MVDKLKRSLEQLDPPNCPNCSIEMKWTSSTFIDATTIAHVFVCAGCSCTSKTRSTIRAINTPPQKLSAPRHTTLLRPHQGRHSAAPLRRACRRSMDESGSARRFRLQPFRSHRGACPRVANAAASSKSTTDNDAKSAPTTQKSHNTDRPNYAGLGGCCARTGSLEIPSASIKSQDAPKELPNGLKFSLGDGNPSRSNGLFPILSVPVLGLSQQFRAERHLEPSASRDRWRPPAPANVTPCSYSSVGPGRLRRSRWASRHVSETSFPKRASLFATCTMMSVTMATGPSQKVNARSVVQRHPIVYAIRE